MKYFYRLITVFVVLSLLMNLKGGLPEAEAQEPVNFPDTNLADKLRALLELGATDPITQVHLKSIAKLVINNAGISNLTGLENATNLRVLSFWNNQIRDISPLSGLTEMTELVLGKNQIRDISPLSGLTNITSLNLSFNQIRDISPLSGLTEMTVLILINNPIGDLSPLSTLSKLEAFVIHSEFDEKNPGILARVIPANTQIYFVYPTNPGIGLPIAREELTRKTVPRCGLGWAPQSPYTHHLQQPKVMMYALEFEFREGRYICKTIEIRTGDATISHLDGWQLYLGTLYNPSYMPIVLTQANSQITDGVLRLTPEMLGLETFPCNTAGGISHPLPGVHYVLKSDANLLVDTAYSCFIWGQSAYTTVAGVNVESPRRISSGALREMETPRLERYIWDNTGVYITYMDLEAFTWDRVVLSDWLLPSSEPSARGAPSAIQRKIATTWGSLKAPE